jgi:hypothetical protein
VQHHLSGTLPYACTPLSITGHSLAAMEGYHVIVMINFHCQHMLENMSIHHSCILYYAPYTLLTIAAGSLKNDTLYSDTCPQMIIMGFHDAITSKSCLISQQHEGPTEKRLTGTPQKQPLTKHHSL